jgi:hypothetical protein
VALVNAPTTLGNTLGSLPHGVIVADRLREDCRVAVWFVRSVADLKRGIERVAAGLTRGSLWIAWPKRSSSLAADLTQQRVREAGLAAGLVDYKVCAIDATWSGLLFTRRRRQ